MQDGPRLPVSPAASCPLVPAPEAGSLAGSRVGPQGSQGEQSPGVRREYSVPATWALGLWDKHLNMIF